MVQVEIDWPHATVDGNAEICVARAREQTRCASLVRTGGVRVRVAPHLKPIDNIYTYYFLNSI